MDNMLGYLIQKLENHQLIDKVNIIILSDHGMAEGSDTKMIALNDYIDPSYYISSQLYTVGFIHPVEGDFLTFL